MKRRIESIMYDFDDTLINTCLVSSQNLVVAAARYKEERSAQIQVPTQEKCYSMYAPTWKEWVQLCIQGIDNFEQAQAFSEFYDEILDELPSFSPFPGALETLTFTRDLPGPQGIMTARTSNHFGKRLSEAGIDEKFFDFYHTGVRKHDDPDALEPGVNIIINRGVKRENIAYVGDHTNDYFAAVSVGIHFIGVLTGPRSQELMRLKMEEDHLVLPSIRNIPAYIKIQNTA
jgi:phosphoglycolate phosphatase-like HAD superfamily hydrolase